MAAAQTSGLFSAAQAAPAGASSGYPKANVLLVHGAWVDGSSWNQVTAILQRRGHNVVAVQLPLTSLADDVAWTRHVLAERLQGPTVLAGHSYGGAVISGAATGVESAIGLVFASAFAPDEGETLGGLNAQFPAPPGLAHAQPDSLGFLSGSIRLRSRPISPRTSRWRRRGRWLRRKNRSRRAASPIQRGRRRGGPCRRGSWSLRRTG